LNGHGDVVQTVSEAGQVENQYDYDNFGNPILTIETEYKNAIRYAGEFYDEETGLYYLRARYYDPYIGRFI
jgi:RHS repeat-associated protein